MWNNNKKLSIPWPAYCRPNRSERVGPRLHAGSQRRVQEVVRVKQKKIKIESFSNGLNHRGSICGVRFGSNGFCGVALRASVSSVSDIWPVFGCEGFRSSALAGVFFYAVGPPWVCSELNGPCCCFSVGVCAINKKSSRTGRFFIFVSLT